MITKDEMIPMLLRASPGFTPKWEEFLKEYEEEKDDLPYYLCLSDFARYLINKLASGETLDFEAIFNVVEKWHLEGNRYVREAATIGLLESLQNANLHETTDPEHFRKYLKPKSEEYWNKLYEFWEEGNIITDE